MKIPFVRRLGWRGVGVGALGLAAILAGAKSELMAQAGVTRLGFNGGSLTARSYVPTESGWTESRVFASESTGGPNRNGASALVSYTSIDWSNETETSLWTEGQIPGSDVAISRGLTQGRVNSSLPATLAQWTPDGSSATPVTVLFNADLTSVTPGTTYQEMTMISQNYPQQGIRTKSRFQATSSWDNKGTMGISVTDGMGVLELVPNGTEPDYSILRRNHRSFMEVVR